MAKLVDVYLTEENNLIKKRQLPLDVDENLTMIMDLSDSNLLCDVPIQKGKDFDGFMQKYNMLSTEDIKNAFQVTCKDLLDILSQTIPCVGCRRSVEKMFYMLKKYGHPTFDPMEVTKEGYLSVCSDALACPQTMCALLHDYNSRMNALVEGQVRSKKSRRCSLHSLETQRHRGGTVGSWLDVWGAMHSVCREEALLVETSVLLHTLEAYLRKHRFCTECRSKVLQAYSLLVAADGEAAAPPEGVAQPTAEELKGYQKALYEGIEFCPEEKHLHVRCNTDFVAQLITRAEPELNGSRRERHAKTLEVAQEEVLTCIGLCLYDRLHRIQQRLREEERTARVLAAAATQALGRNFQLAVDEKRGKSQLMLLYEEITKEELAKQHRKEHKKQKRRRKKEKKAEGKDGNCEFDEEATCKESVCSCEDCDDPKEEVMVRSSKKDVVRKLSCKPSKKQQARVLVQQNRGGCSADVSCDSCQSAQKSTPAKKWSSARCASQQSHDCGYSSEGNETISGSCSLPSSPEGSEVACSDGFCNHEGECSSTEASKENSNRPPSPKTLLPEKKPVDANGPRTLLQMLEDPLSSDEEDSERSFIPAEDVKAFKAQLPQVMEKRKELRKMLLDRFDKLCKPPC
ncbi:gametogenetin-binding protein 2 [Neocloeon triangulifer]|uniref:gametogenetin-binding protein 2 n=1 Tax=Neocloeon triangulifer TaxID=2078957 RepID=UPI00286FAE75|nr:gametogenetin-binding protein 2 [Neocloeon triangulifer]